MAVKQKHAFTCDLCEKTEVVTEGTFPEQWLHLDVDLRDQGYVGISKDICERCVSAILTKKNAHCR